MSEGRSGRGALLRVPNCDVIPDIIPDLNDISGALSGEKGYAKTVVGTE